MSHLYLCLCSRLLLSTKCYTSSQTTTEVFRPLVLTTVGYSCPLTCPALKHVMPRLSVNAVRFHERNLGIGWTRSNGQILCCTRKKWKHLSNTFEGGFEMRERGCTSVIQWVSKCSLRGMLPLKWDTGLLQHFFSLKLWFGPSKLSDKISDSQRLCQPLSQVTFSSAYQGFFADKGLCTPLLQHLKQ